ncbi:MAG: cation:proton antiporter [bacterium]|nr:cation:proton antiporter [bacterium]
MEMYFLQMTLILGLAALVSLAARLLRQPLVLAYILTGIILGPLLLNTLRRRELFDIFGAIGIAFLLFLVGLELNPRRIREFGRAALATGLIQIGMTLALGYLLATRLNIGSSLSAVYLAMAVTFSSTIIVVKLFAEKGSLNALYGKIVVGILLVQDFAAMLALLLPPRFGDGGLSWEGFLQIAVILARSSAVFLAVMLAGAYVLPFVFRNAAKNSEMLLTVSLAWLFTVSALAIRTGFGIQIGAFLAGVSLAYLPYSQSISARVSPLRDFFIIIFFVSLGANLNVNALSGMWPALIIIVLFVLLVKPLIVMAALGYLGYRKRTSFMSAVSIGQISEFSLILTAAGLALGQIGVTLSSLITAAAVISIAISTYMIYFAENIYRVLSGPLSIFERSDHGREELEYLPQTGPGHNILFGYHRIGYYILEALRQSDEETVVVDFNPDYLKRLVGKGIPSLYGDISDPDILKRLGADKAKRIISTIPDYRDNHLMVEQARELSTRPVIIVTADQVDEALDLYDTGADYVIMPQVLSAEFTASLLGVLCRDSESQARSVQIIRQQQIERLLQM